MAEKFSYSDIGKRYHTYDFFLRKKFGGKVAKLALDIGLTCPNRDGSKGVGGCAFCSGRGSGDFCSFGSVTEQLRAQKEILDAKWKPIGYIPYFQACTGTYAPLSELFSKWREALDFPGTVGLAIATRADCLEDDVCDALKKISERTFLTVELGLQTVNDAVAEKMNRCHTYSEFLEGYKKLRQRDIPICVHLINGLPGETREDMLNTAKTVSALRPEFIKLHLLHVLKNTPLEKSYSRGEFSALTLEEYVSTVVDQLELFPPETVFERITGDGKGEDLIAPDWSKRKREVLNAIDKELRSRNTYQGAKYLKDDHLNT